MKAFKPSKIHIIHYHLHSGGVTNTIVHAVKALLESSQFSYIKKIMLFSGSRKNLLNIQKIFNDERVEIHYKKYLGYIEWLYDPNKKHPPPSSSQSHTRNNHSFHEKQILLQNAYDFFHTYNSEDTLWWVHNYHLGKNPLFTLALLQFINNNNPKILLQIHDFPEQARFNALKKLILLPGEDKLYSFNSHTRISVINEHDRNILRKSYLQAHLLPNIVTQRISQSSDTLNKNNNFGLKSYIAQSQKYAHNIDTDNTQYLLFSYPVRCIRRKNVLEAMMIAKMFEARFNIPCALYVTLPGESEKEKPYSRIVEKLFVTKKIRGAFHLSKKPQFPFSFEDICKQSDAIISSSVLEGFGFSYLDSVLYDSPLIARTIPSTKVFKDIFSLYWPSTWYKNINVPSHIFQSSPNIVSLKVLKLFYKKKIEELPSILTTSMKKALICSFNTILEHNSIDFSFFNVFIQEYLLQHFNILKRELMYANMRLLQKIYNMLLLFNSSRKIIEYYHGEKKDIKLNDQTTPYPSNETEPKLQEISLQVIQKHFGKTAFLKQFSHILEDIEQEKVPSKKIPYNIFLCILHQHITLDNLRLLYDDV